MGVPASILRKRVQIRGTVQGVGFRPFVYRLANALNLKGHVLNMSGGVIVEIEGPEQSLASFLNRLKSEAPPLAEIETIEIDNCEPTGDASFTQRRRPFPVRDGPAGYRDLR
jgi:hydrogenase maturation protein HypF